ncbi:McrC family protein [Caulobacter sp. LjRoot300]|uniref:McrC family protein n=1 Tax=Caulobacter sp. LjRoot300 TaxID=3342321 RepID=UPI003ECE18AE
MSVEGEKLIITMNSRATMTLPLAALLTNGELSVLPHIEEKGLLFLQFRRGSVLLNAGKYVGLIPLTNSIAIDVQPKMPVGNLSRVLGESRATIDYISGSDRLYEAFGSPSANVLEFILRNLISALQPIESNGTLKQYVQRVEVAAHPRGRIRAAATLQTCRARGIKHRAVIERFDQTSDIAPNRVIRSALVHLLTSLRRGQPDRALLRRGNEAFSRLPGQIRDASSYDYIDCQHIVRFRTLPTGREYYYRPLDIALLVLSGRGIALDQFSGNVILDTFIVDFEAVFERYLRNALESRVPTHIAVLDGNEDGQKPLYDDRAVPPAQPDIVLVDRETGQKIVVEVKYKDKPDRGDINQAITYALSYRTNRVVLVHQKRDGSVSGLRRLGIISGISVECYAYDLSREDLEAEEEAFTSVLSAMLLPVSGVQAA